ncbi:MAG: TIGR03808 family TAT-translocated repetitive protein [Devosia sp.]
MQKLHFTRRQTLTGLAVLLAAPAIVGRAAAADFINPFDYGLNSETEGDQSQAIQAAIDAAVTSGKDLLLPSGEYTAQNLQFAGNMRVIGSSRGTYLNSLDGAPVGRVGAGVGFVLDGVTLGGAVDTADLLLEECDEATIRNCSFGGRGVGIGVSNAAATVENCDFFGLGDAAIHSMNGKGLMIRGNRISECGNAGVRIWRSEHGPDRSIITGNRISKIDWKGGGNGQNGNGVNVYRADEVIVSDNVISDCAFSAVRVNGGHNTQIRGNTCTNSGEVAIFSEFEFSGSIVANNIIDGAASGIDITNLDSGGYLATCTGNIVRNITPKSAVNPDTVPVGVYAEADTVVANNTIEKVPGIGIVAGFGPFLRNVVITGNVLSEVNIGIGVTVVQAESRGGAARVTDNLIGKGTTHGIVGMEWQKIVSDDLQRDAGNYPNITVSDNTVL